MPSYPLYHALPDDMATSTLYPLAQLKHISTPHYNSHFKRFPDHQKLYTQNVPILNCTKADVIFLTPIPPHALNREHKLRSQGKPLPSTKFVKLDLTALDLKHAVQYISYNHTYPSTFLPISRDFKQHFHELQRIPPAARTYWLNFITINPTYQNNPLLFEGTTLILYNQPIDITHCPIISIN